MWKNLQLWNDGATPPAAKALTAVFAVGGGEWFVCPDSADSLVIDIFMASTVAPTNVDLQLLWSEDGGTTIKGPWDLTQYISGGVEEHQDLVLRTVSTADGHHTVVARGLVPGLAYQVWARAAGGTAPTALVTGSWGASIL